MYNYDFKNEKVLHEVVNNLISFNDKECIGNILITENKLLIFQNILRGNVISSRGIQEMPQYELLLEYQLDSLDYEINAGNTIVKEDNNEIILYDFDLKSVK